MIYIFFVMYYKQSVVIDRPIGNNAFVYDDRKQLFGEAKIVVPELIVWTIHDVKLGNDIVFTENIDGKVMEFMGLEKLVCSITHNSPIYIMDNHNHALYCWYKEYLAWNIARWLPVIHIDQHSDMNNPVGWIDMGKEQNLDYIATYVNEVCTIADFIQPALRSGLVSECIQMRTEYTIMNYELWIIGGWYILDIDIDFWAPEMGIQEWDHTIQKTRQLIAGASMVTIATSPCFIDQDRALEIVTMLLD